MQGIRRGLLAEGCDEARKSLFAPGCGYIILPI
jgi:hypothetical protein